MTLWMKVLSTDSSYIELFSKQVFINKRTKLHSLPQNRFEASRRLSRFTPSNCTHQAHSFFIVTHVFLIKTEIECKQHELILFSFQFLLLYEKEINLESVMINHLWEVKCVSSGFHGQAIKRALNWSRLMYRPEPARFWVEQQKNNTISVH